MELQISINNFKSVSSVDLKLKEGLNILIGPNGSGKTCLLSSLKFVRDMFLFGAAQALAKNGGAKRVYRRGTDIISFAVKLDYGDRIYRGRKRPSQLSWEIHISQTGPGGIATVIYEDLRIVANVDGKEKVLFQFTVDRKKLDNVRPKYTICEPNIFGRDLFSRWEFMYSTSSKPIIYQKFQELLSKNIARPARRIADESIFPHVARFDRKLQDLYELFSYLNEYNIMPDIARQATEQLPFAQMQPNGAGVSEVIHALEKRNYSRIEMGRYYDPPSYEGYEFYEYELFPHRYYQGYYPSRFRLSRRRSEAKAVGQALENINRELSAAVKPIEIVSVATDPTNGRRFVVFRAGKETFMPEEVSDGTIKWLCILLSIFVPYSLVYLLEEPENFLHPWMQQRLIQIMREHAKLNNTIFLLASHSSTVLNAATPAEVIVVSSTEHGTEISEIEDRKAIEQVLAKSDFRLGDFWVSGAIGGVP